MASDRDKLGAPGRHTRRPGRARLRRVCVAALIMLVVEYGLGIFLNLYVAVPASDAHAGIFQQIATAPLALTLHALLGLGLIATAILLLARSVGAGDRRLAVLATAGLTAIGGAFGAGEIFVRNGQPGASLAMAILTRVALLCYVSMLALAAAAERHGTGPRRPRMGPQWQGTGPHWQVTASGRPVRAPRPRIPATPPAPWPATPARGLPAQRSWPDGEGWPDGPLAAAPGSWAARE
jgi:hypothetical protein